MYMKFISGWQQELKTILCSSHQYKLIKPLAKNQIVIFATDDLLYDDIFSLLHSSG